MLKAFNLIDGIANKYTVLPTVYQHLKYNSDKWVKIVSFLQGHLLVVKYVSAQKFKLSLNIICSSLCFWVIVFYFLHFYICFLVFYEKQIHEFFI